MRITHYGHACVLVEAVGARVLIDPGTFSQAWHDLTDLDAVLITHQHADHVDPEHVPALLEANPQAAVYTPADIDEAVQLPSTDAGAPRSVIPGAKFSIGDLQVQVVGGEHAVIHAEIPVIRNNGYVLSHAEEPSFFHPGDGLTTAVPGVDVLALPVMAPWSAMKEQVEFVRALDVPAQSIAIHDALLSDRGRELFGRQIQNLTGTEIIWLAEGEAQEFTQQGTDRDIATQEYISG